MHSAIGDVASEFQYGFIPERQISDNILLSTVLIRGYTRAHVSLGCLLKVDLKKAYDSINRSLIKDIMVELGFPDCFIKWVFTCITTVSYNILINGRPTKPFSAKKGLRQGDLMSPFMFAIGIEYLTRNLQQLQAQPDFNFHLKCEKLAITHLMFADDLLMFSRDDIQSIQMMSASFT
ncbi:secreted RxLR effector protein 78-like [Spinacia oleracea]|uniref:Secreted RxLR effector protein 78-like n=1 Tax=Spinacia oleracea TaxID=3562 RepID=A0ABM3R4G3_SPIOL|nr:secreted RxLR effector protein 78-like [Spinacia oleracea]